MPITFTVADCPAEPVPSGAWSARTPTTVLSSLNTAYVPEKILQSSVPADGSLVIYTKKNGIIPDDVWIAILSQLNFYINAHAEDLRSKFVSHADKKELVVISESTTVEGMDFGELSVKMSALIDDNINGKLFNRYFTYKMTTRCGIPTITLEGTQGDWQSVLDRIDKISEFGVEPTEWAGMLRGILTRFVRVFDVKDGQPDVDKIFWERMLHEERSSGTYWIGGWMSAFCAWDAKGVFFADRNKDTEGWSMSLRRTPDWARTLKIDGYAIPRVQECPEGYAEVDVLVEDVINAKIWDCRMLAGHIGFSLAESRLDTIRMAPQWFMYLKGEVTKPLMVL
ncbi:hypothetical protein H0H93_010534 [Arthromyces matolae]|nr:hypothetical protein H0H93_010534 [Arthromyces matolae]